LKYQSRETAKQQERGAEEVRVREFLIQNYLITDQNELGDDDSFLERGILDSTSVLELVAYLESTFGIKVQDEELVPENLDSVARVAAFVRNKRNVSTGTHG
jgi:acyl carrier protein